MKILYSQIKELVPGLKAKPKDAGAALAMAGFMMDGFSEVKHKNKTDYLISLEIRQNRADCLSVFGLAREVAAYYGLKVKLPMSKKIAKAEEKLNVKIEAKDFVKRVIVIKLSGLKNGASPEWLKEYMELQGLNSVNLLVDLSNYVMFLTGYPSHLIDTSKMHGNLRWSMSHGFTEITTLAGTAVKLNSGQELLIRDDKNIIALTIIGSKAAEIGEKTTEALAEIAVYDHSLVRKNSRSLSVVTEASHRLEKILDPNGARPAMELLISLIEKYAGGKAVSRLFDYYPKKYASPVIEFDPKSPSKFAGIEIPPAAGLKILKNLEFNVKKSGKKFLVAPPAFRQDVSLNEDLAEEVIRIYGYDKIGAAEMPKLEATKDITPKNIILAEQIRDILTARRFDEILSWPLVKDKESARVNFEDWRTITTQNSINELFPDLRQSLATGLFSQLESYIQKNVEFIKIFEIGIVFGEKNGHFKEHEALGILSLSKDKGIKKFKDSLEILLRSLGLNDLKYFKAKTIPPAANPGSCWDIFSNADQLGIIYKLRPEENKTLKNSNIYFSEINLTALTGLLKNIKNEPVVELTKKLIPLDANIELNKNDSVYKYLESLEKKLDKKNIWSISIADVFPLNDKVRYTVRVVYKELTDQEAKKIHLEAFNL